MALAVFDIDNTLVCGQTHRHFLRFARREREIGFVPYLVTVLWFISYKLGFVNGPEKVMDYAVGFMKGRSERDIAGLVGRFRSAEFSGLFFKNSRSLLESHRAKGDRILLVTNLIEPLARAIAEELGVHDLIATRLELVGGVYTGRISGKVVYGAEKLSQVAEFARANGLSLADASGYGDHSSDIPMLEKLGHVTLVNPTLSLSRLAESRGWKTLRLT